LSKNLSQSSLPKQPIIGIYAHFMLHLFTYAHNIHISEVLYEDIMTRETKGFLIELFLFAGVLCPIAISMLGGKDSYFWQVFAWLIS